MSNNDEIAIRINDIHKEFVLPQSKNSSFKQAAVNIVKKNNKVTQKVLDGVSFSINKGEFFGIVGRNGSGKSTLLKLIAGVYTPTSGSIELNGGLTPFIELGVGFNPEISGRDNVYLNGALLGFTRTQVDEFYDDVVEFAELGPFMGQKLKNYSSGMQVRLAFAIAIKAKNDILIFDEVLAVGDEAFQRKCLDVFETYRKNKQTVILVSHDMETVRRFCTKAALIHEGKLIELGSAHDVAAHYSKLNEDEIDQHLNKQNIDEDNTVLITILNKDRKPAHSFSTGETMIVEASWKKLDVVESVGVNIFKRSGEHISGHNTRFDDSLKNISNLNSVSIEYTLDIAPGSYFVFSEVFKREGHAYTQKFDGPSFIVRSTETPTWSGLLDLPHVWKH